MTSIRSRFTRSIGTVLCTMMFLAPTSASAQWVDPANLVQNILQVLQQIAEYVLSNSDYTKEYVLDPVQKAIATGIERTIINSAMNWARNGFEGNPSFVINPRDFVIDTERNEAEVFAEQVNNSANRICSPYRVTVINAAAQAAAEKGESSGHDQGEVDRLTECELDRLVTGGVIENYYAPGGYERDGLDPVIRATLSRKDNPYEAPEVVIELQSARQAKAVKQAQSETVGGTLPNKRCLQRSANGNACLRFENFVPASNVSDLVSQVIGQSVVEIAGQDELTESIFAGVIQQFTNRALSNQGIR